MRASLPRMRRASLVFVGAALLMAAALTFAFVRSPSHEPESAFPAAAPRAAPATADRSVPAPAVAARPAPAPAAAPAPPSAPRLQPPADPEALRVESELVALEEEALRRLDVVPILEEAGIDVRQLRARPDGEAVMRHVAGDEVLLRATEREMFSTTIYPAGYSKEQAVNDVRETALRMVSALTPEGRAAALASELDMRRTVERPQPEFHPDGSGRVYDAHTGEGDRKDESAND